MPPVDSQARARALDTRHSFAVSAPAGSGKTGLLTQRLLALLLTCDAPEEVLAITFTRKAAGEMRERIIKALHAADAPCPSEAHAATTWQLARDVLARDAELGWQLLQNPNRLRLQTIDGLCRQLARQLPLESGLGSLPEPVELATPLYRRAIRAVYDLLETDQPLAADVACVLAELDNRYSTFESLLMGLLANRDQWLSLALGTGAPGARDELEESLKSIIFSNLSAIYEALYEHQLSLCELARYAADNCLAQGLDTPINSLQRLAELPDTARIQSGQLESTVSCYRALADLLLTSGGGWRKRLDKNMGFPTDLPPALDKTQAKAAKEQLMALIQALSEQDDLLEQLQTLRALPPPAYTDEQWRLIDALSRLLPRLVAELTLVFASEGAADFIDTAQAALRALGQFDEPTDLALRLDYQIRHILIDEFQDTSAPQRALIEHLTAGWQPGDGRTLFIVGDGMQSCYGFRNANVGIFLQARQRGIGDLPLEALDLQVNFRSQAGVVDWVNRHFAAAFPARDDIARGAVAYLPSVAAKPPSLEAAVRLTLVAGDEDSDSFSQSLMEAQAVCERIHQLRQQHPDQTIALLARSRPHLRDTLRLLDQAGIRYQAAELDRLADRMPVQDLISLLRAVTDPTDRISWLALLRAPWCGLDNADLLALARIAGPLPLADGWPSLALALADGSYGTVLSPDGRARVARMNEPLQQALATRGRKPLRDWLEGLWTALGGPASLSHAVDYTNCQRLLELVESHTEGSAIRDWQAFEEAVAQLYAAPDAQSDPRLQVMTIHKSKGLEFDQVILLGLHRPPRNEDRALMLWLEQLDDQGQPRTLISPLSNFEDSPLYQYLQREQKARAQAEAVRLFYVGCTRAIEQLHLFGAVQQKDKALKPPVASSLLASIWPTAQAEALIISPELPAQLASANPLTGADRIGHLPGQWRFQPPADSGVLAAFRGRQRLDAPSVMAGETQTAPPDLNRPAATLFEADARALGTELHRLIEQFTQSGQLPDQARLTALEGPVTARLRAARHSQPARAFALIQASLLRMASSQHGRWLLDHQHQDSQTELALWQPARQPGKPPRQWILDRTFVDRGVRWVVDYKSSHPDEGQSLESFLEDQRKRYAAQLNRYQQLLQGLGPEPVKAALYFPILDQFMVI